MSRWERPEYNRYKGKNRSRVWQIAGLSVLLVLLLVRLARRQCAVDNDDGSVRIELPWQQEAPVDRDETDVIIVRPGSDAVNGEENT